MLRPLTLASARALALGLGLAVSPLAANAADHAEPDRAGHDQHDHTDHGAGHDPEAHAAAPAPIAPDATLVAVDADRLVIRIQGMVCSFCAYGVEKGLAELSFLDPAHFGDGVLVDIDRQQVTLALRAGHAVDFAALHTRIRKAGYEPQRFHVHVRGEAVRSDDAWEIRGQSPAQRFALSGGPALEEGATVQVQAHLDAAIAAAQAPDRPVPVVFDALR